jgi:endonuclease YncB( thermonuclease family)
VDGDTLVYRDDHRRVRKLRLKGIDSPEYRPLQEHGAEAKQALAGKVDGRRIELRILEVDQHGRDLGIVFHLGRNINEELVAEGHAWNFAYRSDPAHPRLDSLERQARSGRKGLWLGQRPMHPKDFRARNRS